jgi:hypothetical protein
VKQMKQQILATAKVCGVEMQWVERDGQTGVLDTKDDSFEPISRGDMVHCLLNEDLRVTNDGRRFLAS